METTILLTWLEMLNEISSHRAEGWMVEIISYPGSEERWVVDISRITIHKEGYRRIVQKGNNLVKTIRRAYRAWKKITEAA